MEPTLRLPAPAPCDNGRMFPGVIPFILIAAAASRAPSSPSAAIRPQASRRSMRKDPDGLRPGRRIPPGPAPRAQGPGPSASRTGRGGGALIPAQETRGGSPPYPEVMLICEELFLLLTKDSGAFESYGGNNQFRLRGAVLLDLILAGRLSLSPDKRPRVTVLDASPTGHTA